MRGGKIPAMSGVSQLRTKDITESSVTLFWTPPPVQYDTYHLTFVSQKEGDQQITSQVGGKLTTYTQTGLAAGQEYTVTVKGEIDGKLGANSTAEFTTLISGPTNLRVVKTTTTSAVVQWEQSQGDIDRYRLSVEPHQKDGNAKGRQELTLPPERDSAQIDGLDPGRLYDITLVAEKGKIKSKPATVQVTPGKSTKTISRKAIETATSHIATGVRIHKGQAEGNTKPMRVNKKTTGEGPEMTKTIQGPGSGTVYGTNRTKENPSNSTSTRLLVNKKEKVVPKINGKITLNRRPQIGDSIRFNGTRVIQGVRRVGQSLLQKPASRNPILGIKKTVDDESKPKNPIAGDKTKAITVKDTKLEINLRGENSGTLTKTHPAVILPEIPHIKDLSDTKHGRETEINGPGPGREGLEHTITGHRYPTASSPSLESPASNKPQPTSAPPKPDQSKAGKALSVSPARFSTLPPDAQPKRPPVSSNESEQSGKGDHSASVNSEELHSTKDGAAVIVDGHDTYRDIIGGRVRSSTEQNKTLTVGGTSPVRQLPPKLTRLPRPYPNMGPFQNRTRSYPRPPQHLSRGPVRSPLPPKQINRGDNSIIIQTTQPGGKGTYSTTQNETSTDLTPKDLLQRKNATATAQGYTHRRSEDSSRQMGHNSKTGHHDFGSLVDTTAVSRGSPNQINGSDVPTTITNGQPLISVGVRSLTSGGFILIWGAPEGMYKNFIVTREEQGSKKEAKKGNEEEGEAQTDKEIKGNKEVSEREVSQGKNGGEEKSVSNRRNDHNGQRSNSNTTAKVERRILKFSKVLPGSARSFPFKDLQPQTHYSLSVFGKGPGIRSKIHRLIVRTGPEPPSGLLFSDVTDTSLYVSWTKPKSPVSGFKVTYTNTMEGEPVSVLVDPGDSTLPLSKLTPGSSYEVSVISILGQDESDTIKDLVVTLPDPPTDLRAINVTDTKALLLWRPALATVDRYVVVYGSEKGSDERMITVSGNAAEQQLKELQPSTTYTVRVTSQLGSRDSSPATAVFTTTRGSDGDVLRDLEASQVTARSALLTWKAPSAAVGSYRLSYQTVGQEIQEVTVDSTETEFMLTRLHPLSKYTVQLQGERGGSHTAALSTEFTTGNLRYPFPSDCSQELLNGIRESGEVEIFPKGKQGKPLLVYCDQETDGGGWTVFQRRMNGKTDFFRGWKNYSRGFGELSGEFWLGNENLHDLTSVAPMTLRVDLRVGDESVFAKYSTFSVDTFRRNYALKVSGYSGTAGDSMSYHNGRPFSTKDRDPMPFITRCAMSYRGGWWYKNCHEANLNGLYNTNVHHQGVIWTTWKGKDFSIPSTEMKFRPASFTPPVQG
ncbi:tenascin isoform X2 [Esox lucius]|nr:tenascin isoform X2 [Esox lucius]